MDRDLNAYRCAEPHGGCCQTSKIRPDNYFFAGASFGELILGRSCGSIGARIAVGMGDQENDVDGYVGQDRTGEAADFRAAHAGRTEAVAIGFRWTKPPRTEDQVRRARNPRNVGYIGGGDMKNIPRTRTSRRTLSAVAFLGAVFFGCLSAPALGQNTP